MSADQGQGPGLSVRGTEILASDPPRVRRQKLARITLDSMVQFVGLLDARGTVLEINEVALHAVGIQLADVEGRPFWTTFWWQVSEEVNQTLREMIARAARGEFVRWDTPIYGRAGGAETIIIDASLCPVLDEQGSVVFICAEGRDITEKKAQEREIAQKNLELSALLERIRELDEIKTQFFANVSHELRTPLALILGPAQRLIDDDAGALGLAQRRESARVIARNARMLLRHVNDLLDMSRLEARKLKIELRNADVAALLRFVASHFAVLAADRGIEYAVEADLSCVAAVDPEKLQRVLMNLLGNAFKFAPAGGRVRCALRQRRNELAITVDDSGPGVAPALRQAIFERFRQAEGGIDRKLGGTGLGLAIAKEFVEMHKGRIEVLDSDLGGARFQVALPAGRLAGEGPPVSLEAVRIDVDMVEGMLDELRSVGPERREVEAPAPSRADRPRVLVVEDNPDMNRFIAESLCDHYEVVSAFDGREGLERALALHLALIVSDIMMPVLSGVGMIAALRRHAELAETPILVLSAKADEELKVRLLEQGAQDFITKPFSEKDVLVRVRNLVEARAARQRERQEASVTAALYRVASAFANELDAQKLMQLVIDEATALTGAEVGCFCFEAPAERDGSLRYRLSGAPGLPLGSYLGVPVEGSGGELLGGLFFGHRERGRFGELQARIGRGLAAHAAAALERARLYEALRVSDARAREADRRKDEFLAMLGHELRNPLAPIMTALQIMELRGETKSVREQQVIDRQVRHLGRLVDDLLDIARVTGGKLQIQRQRLDIAAVVEKAVEMASPLLEQRRHTLRIAVPRNVLWVDADPGRLAQVVANLLTNAAKYTDPGGSIVLEARAEARRILVSVRDNGQGIAPELRSQIFDLFVQGRRGSDRSQGGLGIGLALVRNVVELHGGRVDVHSDGPGQGSEFVVELPAAAVVQSGDESAEAPRTAPRAPAGSRILLVDDNADAANILADALSLLGDEVLVANDAPQALALAERFPATVALLDIGLPVMDGYELAEQLRRVWGERRVRFIAITGYGQESDKERARASGFDAHLTKPIELRELVSLLHEREGAAS